VRSSEVLDLARDALDELKARDVEVLDVRKMTTITDYFVIASGTSDRHVKSLAERIVESAKQAGLAPLGVEGLERGEWVLVDLADVVVHVMQPQARDFYKLESLWSVGAPGTHRPG
jgi:ribosome-associated protein